MPVKRTTLSPGLRFRDVESVLPSLGRVSQGRSYTPFLPQGYAIPTMIHLEDDDGEEYTVEIHPFLGRAEIHDGRVEMD